MKKRFTLFSAAMQAMLMVPLLASAAGYLNRISHTASYDYSNMEIGTDTLGGVAYATVACEGMYNDGNPGMPSLPIDYIRFSVPYNATNFTVTATGVRWSSQNLDHMVFPCQVPWFTDGSPAPAITLPDSAAYFSGNPYPSQMAWIADEGFLAGENHIVTVAVMPLRYSHSATADVLSGARRCSLTLSYDLSDSLAMYPIVRNDSLLREEGYQLTQSMVVNPGQVKGFAPLTQVSTGIDSTGSIHGGIGGDIINGGGISGPDPIDPGSLGEEELLVDGGNYTYLIITTSELKHAMRRLVALKRQKGYNVKIVTMNDVLSSPLSGSGDVIGKGDNAHLTFTDNAGKLRQYIRNHYYYYGTKYVLLAGKDIPYRMYDSEFYPDGHGDLYYSELNANWQNHPYELERFPEVYVGRLTYSSSEDVNNNTNKILRYELNPGNGEYSYLRRALFTEGRDYLHNLDEVRNKMSSFFPNQTVMRDSIENGDFPKGRDIIDSINNHQYGFMTSLNHGSPAGIKTYGTDSITHKKYFLWAVDSVNHQSGYIDTLETHNGLNRVMNADYPMVYYSLSCQTAPYFRVNGSDVDMSFGESFTLGRDYGGPAYLGYTTTAYSGPSIQLCLKFIQQLKSYRRFKVGEAEAMSKFMYTGGERTAVSVHHNLLGDPTMEIWTSTPNNNHDNIHVTRFDDSISISGMNTLPYQVAHCSNDGEVGLIKAIVPNCSISDISPNSTILIYSHSYIPYIAPLFLQNITMSNSQYVIASDVTAGFSVEARRSYGEVTVKKGVEYEIEATGTVILDDGFQVEKGATFAVYPACF